MAINRIIDRRPCIPLMTAVRPASLIKEGVATMSQLVGQRCLLCCEVINCILDGDFCSRCAVQFTTSANLLTTSPTSGNIARRAAVIRRGSLPLMLVLDRVKVLPCADRTTNRTHPTIVGSGCLANTVYMGIGIGLAYAGATMGTGQTDPITHFMWLIGISLVIYFFIQNVLNVVRHAFIRNERLGVGGRVFAMVLSLICISAGAGLCWLWLADPTRSEYRMKLLPAMVSIPIIVGLLGLRYCVFQGQNPQAPKIDNEAIDSFPQLD